MALDVSCSSHPGIHDNAMDGPSSTRRAARKAEGGRRRLATEWVVIPLVIVLVFIVVFGLRFLVA
jgi:hypothetical protein